MLGYVLSLVLFGHGQNLWLIFGVSMLGTLVFVFSFSAFSLKRHFRAAGRHHFGNVIDSLPTFIAYKYDAMQNLSASAVANFANLVKGILNCSISQSQWLFSAICMPHAFLPWGWERFCDQSGFELSTGHDHRCGLSLHHVGDRGHDCRSTAVLGFACA